MDDLLEVVAGGNGLLDLMMIWLMNIVQIKACCVAGNEMVSRCVRKQCVERDMNLRHYRTGSRREDSHGHSSIRKSMCMACSYEQHA